MIDVVIQPKNEIEVGNSSLKKNKYKETKG